MWNPFRRTKDERRSPIRSTSVYIARIFVVYWLLTWYLSHHGIGPALLSPNKAMGIFTALLAAVYLVVRLQLFLLVPGMLIRLIWLWASAALWPEEGRDPPGVASAEA